MGWLSLCPQLSRDPMLMVLLLQHAQLTIQQPCWVAIAGTIQAMYESVPHYGLCGVLGCGGVLRAWWPTCFGKANC